MQAALVVMLLAAAGCSGMGGPASDEKPLSFRDAPGIIYLRSYGSKDDLDPGFSFRDFIIGEDRFSAAKRIRRPYGVATTKGRVYVCDGREVAGYWVLDLEKQEMHLVHDRALAGALGMAVDGQDRKYVAVPGMWRAKAEGTLGTDKETGDLAVFDADNRRVALVPIKGRPIDVAVHGSRAYVTDGLHHRIVIVDTGSLKIVGQFGKPGSGEDEFALPKGIDVDEEGHVLVADVFNGRIKVFDEDGQFLSQYGNRARVLGTFSNLSGVAADRDGKVYAVDSGYFQKLVQDEVQIFDSTNFYGPGETVPSADTDPAKRKNALYGWFVKPYAVSGGAAGMVRSIYAPVGITIDYDNVPLFRQYEKPGVKFEYLIWITSQFADSGKNLSLFAYATAK